MNTEWDYLKGLSEEEQICAMREWVDKNYDDWTLEREDEDGYNSSNEFDNHALVILKNTFSKYVPENVIEKLEREMYQYEPLDIPEPEPWYPYLPIDILNEKLNSLRKLLKSDLDSTVIKTLNYMIHAYSISALETFLHDEFIRKLFSDDNKLKTFFEKNKDFEKAKLSLNQVMTINPKQIAKKYLETITWHKLEKVLPLYRCVFDVSFSKMDFLFTMIKLRHDIVHRCGKDKEGNEIEVTKENLERLFSEIEELATLIHEKGVSA